MNAIDLEPFLALRRHLRIAHHIPGRIRLRIGAAVFREIRGVGPEILDRVLGAIDGIEAVQVNKAAGSVVINYKPAVIRPSWWDTLLRGDEQEATALLQRLLEAELAPALAAARRD